MIRRSIGKRISDPPLSLRRDAGISVRFRVVMLDPATVGAGSILLLTRKLHPIKKASALLIIGCRWFRLAMCKRPPKRFN